MTEVQPRAPRRGGGSGTAIVGGILIVLGILFLLGEQLNVDLARFGWPLYVVAPGVALMAFGLTQARGSGLTIAGSTVSIVGLLLLYQNAADDWQSWAYVWPLVGPGGSGMGMLLYGTRSRDTKMARGGFGQIVVALGLFVAGFVFFEGVLGISGNRFPFPSWALPVAVIGLGLAVLVRGLMRGQSSREWTSSADDEIHDPE